MTILFGVLIVIFVLLVLVLSIFRIRFFPFGKMSEKEKDDCYSEREIYNKKIRKK